MNTIKMILTREQIAKILDEEFLVSTERWREYARVRCPTVLRDTKT